MSIERTKEDQERFHADMARIASLPVTKAIEAIERKPTAAAMRAAQCVCKHPYFRERCDDWAKITALLIDRETGLPELITAAESAADWLCDSHSGTDQHERGECLRKALKKAERGNS